QRWLPFELLSEMRAMLRMYLDPRYRLTWQTRVLPAVFLFGMFLSWLLISGIPVVGFLFDRILFLVLAYMLFKVLMREATRHPMPDRGQFRPQSSLESCQSTEQPHRRLLVRFTGRQFSMRELPHPRPPAPIGALHEQHARSLSQHDRRLLNGDGLGRRGAEG